MVKPYDILLYCVAYTWDIVLKRLNITTWGELSSKCVACGGELSSECGASRLGVCFLWGELSWGELSLGRVVLFPFKLFRIAKNRKYRENVG